MDSPPNIISEALDLLFPGSGIRLTGALKKDHTMSVSAFPEKGSQIGINVLTTKNGFPLQNQNTVVLLLWADADSFKAVASELFFSNVDLLAVVFNEDPALNELPSATKAANIPGTADPEVSPYSDNLDD